MKAVLSLPPAKCSCLARFGFSFKELILMVRLYHSRKDLLLFSLSFGFDSLWPHGLQHTSLSCPSLSPRVCSNTCPLNGWCHPTISSSVTPFSSSLQSFPASGSFPVSRLFASSSQSIGVSASASVGMVGSPCSPRDSQESSPAPQFESINSLALSLLYGPILTSVHDYWKNHSFD